MLCEHSNTLLLRRENVVSNVLFFPFFFFKTLCCILCFHASFMMARHCMLVGSELEVTLSFLQIRKIVTSVLLSLKLLKPVLPMYVP